MAAILEFYFQFPFNLKRMCNYPHVMLHPPAKFYRNWTNIGGLLTSYRFFKMAVVESEIYFWVQVWWLHSFKMVKSMGIPNSD